MRSAPNACPHDPTIGINPVISRTLRGRRVVTYDCPCGERGVVLDTEPTAQGRQRNTYVSERHGGSRQDGRGVSMAPTLQEASDAV